MRNVIPNLLWIGSALDVADLSPIFDAGIQAALHLPGTDAAHVANSESFTADFWPNITVPVGL